ncbi:TPR domain-containing protein [Cyclospora cayetanensis]|uniref:TPR domain-containing protein n=1 Tax=Cyclospora cayetanensis TaxID=88456 RepID=A0A1D3D6U6_9EIME|nr:TPR domain-containing protein [Cyclospora cayetanensis]
MKGTLGKALWRLEAELLAPSRGLKGLRGVLHAVADAVEESLARDFPADSEEEAVAVRKELAYLCDLCIWLRRCQWRSVFTRGWSLHHLPQLVRRRPHSACNSVAAAVEGRDSTDGANFADSADSSMQDAATAYPGKHEGEKPPGLAASSEGSFANVEGDLAEVLKAQAAQCCSQGSSLLLALRSRCALVVAIAGVFVFAQANITGPSFGRVSATELLEVKRTEEGRKRHPDLYPSKQLPPAAAAHAASRKGCCCCCFYCGMCSREEALAGVAAAAGTATAASMQQKRCYCEFELRDACVLGSPSEAAAQAALHFQPLQSMLTVDGEAVYEDVRGLSYLWFCRLLLKLLEALQLSAAQSEFPAEPCEGLAEAAGLAELRFEGPLTLFVWTARADFLLQRTLRKGAGASGALRGAVAPSLVSALLFDFAAVLQQLQLLPPGFSCTSKEAVDLDGLLRAADFGAFDARERQEAKQLKEDILNILPNQQARFCLTPPLRDPAASVPAEEPTTHLLLRQSTEDPRLTGLAVLLPDPAWMTPRDRTLLLLELALRLAVFGRVEIFDSVNTMACEAFGVEFVITGAPGIRRKADWESFERPLGVVEQALLLSKSRSLIEGNPCNDPLALEEVGAVVSRALVLPPSGSDSRISTSTKEYYRARLHALEQQPPDEFLPEPNCQLLSPDWVVFSGGLWLRCRTEFHRTKTVERACLQLHALCEQLYDADPPGCYRLFGLLFHADLLSWWELQREVGVRMMRIGATLTAAEKFTELKMWEEAADCLVAADRRADARSLLEKQIAAHPTPHLLCTLADLEKQQNTQRAEDLYTQAWTLSGGRYARAQRGLASLHLQAGRLPAAAAALRLATAASSLHAPSWFALGCCAMKLDLLLEARAAFARVVAIDPEEGDAWANLAAVHCKREAWAAAFQCINEAAKHKRENWMVWETFISISVRLRDVQAIARGLRMLVQINAKAHIDPWIYSFLEELVSFELKRLASRTSEDSEDRAEDGKVPGVLRQTLSCLQFLVQHVSDSAELFRVNDLLQQMKTTVETHQSRIIPEADVAKERMELISLRISALQQRARDARCQEGKNATPTD